MTTTTTKQSIFKMNDDLNNELSLRDGRGTNKKLIQYLNRPPGCSIAANFWVLANVNKLQSFVNSSLNQKAWTNLFFFDDLVLERALNSD